MASDSTVPGVGGSTVMQDTQFQSTLDATGNNIPNTAIWNSYDTCGTMTRADVGLAEAGDLDAIFTNNDGANSNTLNNPANAAHARYRDMESLLVTQLELKACGGRSYGMYDWLMSGAKSMGAGLTKRNISGGTSEIEPFILAAQKDVIKDDYWVVDKIMNYQYKYETNADPTSTSTASSAQTAISGLTPSITLAAGHVIIRCKPHGNNPASVDYFPVGQTVNLFAKGLTATGIAYRLQLKVVSRASNGTNIDVVCTYQGGWGQQDISATEFGTTLEADKVLSFISKYDTGGGSAVLTIGTNNVNDFESWCANRPALNTRKHVPFWYQTSRFSLCVSDFYKEWLERMMRTNAYFNKFGDVSLAERNAQLGLMFQKEWTNSFFFGQPLSDKQKLATYKELPAITSVDSTTFAAGSDIEGAAIGYRANALGVYRQLADCGRVVDKQGAALDLSDLLEDKIFKLVRSRKDQGKPADSIDLFTDSKTAKNIFKAFMVYYKNESSDMLRVNYDITNKNISDLGFYAQSYKLHYPAGVTLNVITNEFFDDLVTAHQAAETGTAISDGSMGRFAMILDLGGGVYPGIIGSNRVVHKSGDLEDLAKVDPSYRCVMANPTTETTLNSTTWTAIVECPTDNLIIENFADTTIAQ
jgi:hypothetical protein